ncbi:MAG: acyl-CoA dehydrogenase family protein [Acidimicrobiales bacterium]
MTTTRNAVDPLLIETIESMLGDLCQPEKVGAAEGGLDAGLWKALVESGMATVGVEESAGGSGGSLQDAAAIAKAAGRHAAPVPLTELSIIGGWVCQQAGLTIPDGPVAVVIGNGDRTYWAPVAEHFVVVTDGGVTLRAAAEVSLGRSGVNYAGEPWADVSVPSGTAGTSGTSSTSGASGVSTQAVRGRGALARSLLMAGALQQATELSVQYCNEREQFGRPIGKFQVLQQYLAQMAGEAAAAEAAADNAVDVVAAGADEQEALRVIAAAKTVTGRAVGIINRLAHQIHGAIGYTDEHRLQYSTRRLWSWRDEHGSEAEWAALLGQSLATAGGAALWPAITAWPPATTG